MDSAQSRLRGARHALEAGDNDFAISGAYYAMLYAARAALSEDEEHARTHRGTWHVFRRRYVATDAFDDSLFALAQQAQKAREQGDYEAVTHDADAAQLYVRGAGEFVAAVERMLAS